MYLCRCERCVVNTEDLTQCVKYVNAIKYHEAVKQFVL